MLRNDIVCSKSYEQSVAVNFEQTVSCTIIVVFMYLIQKKCEQYWPEEGTAKYGDLELELIQSVKYTDFTVRTFQLKRVSLGVLVTENSSM